MTSYDYLWAKSGKRFVGTAGTWDSGASRYEIGAWIGVEASAPDYGPTLIDRVRAEADPRAADLVHRLWPASAIVGTVLDAVNGLPVERASVRRYDRARHWSVGVPGSEDPDVPETLSAADGSFTLLGAGGEGIRLRVLAPGYAPLVEGPFDLSLRPRGRAVLEGRLVFAQGSGGGSVGGIDDDERPAELGISIHPMEQDGEESFGLQRAAIARGGRFEVLGLEPGTYVVRVMQYLPSFDLLQAREIVEITGEETV